MGLLPTSVDLSQCEREPIHLLGAIQPHGVLLAFTEPELRLEVVSANTEVLLGRSPEALVGRPLAEVLSSASLMALTQLLARPATDGFARIEAAGRFFIGLVHRSSGLTVLELELEATHEAREEDSLAAVNLLLSPLLRARGPQGLLQAAADAVRTLIGFDRVMVYRFDADWHGEVVAESLAEGVDGFLGRHFPASDIPAQARALYTRNTLRLIADARARPVPLVPEVLPSLGRPLDLSGAALRSVSPVHLEYLANMGVAASFSLSLVKDGTLWGLIACHHSAPRHLSPATRRACDVLARLLALQLGAEERGAEAEELARRASLRARLMERLSQGAHALPTALSQERELLLALTGASGAAFLLGETPILVGATPPMSEVVELAFWLAERPFGSAFYSERLGLVYPPAAAYADVASGLLAVRLDPNSTLPRYALWFRPEVTRTITWAGNPSKSVVPAPGGARGLHPRASFEAWQETVRGTSLPWTRVDLESADGFRSALVGVVLRHAAALARSNKELDAFGSTVSHDLKEPLRGLQRYAGFFLEDYGAALDEEGRKQLEDMRWLAERTQGLLDGLFEYSRLGHVELAWGEVDMQELVDDVLLLVASRLKENGVEVRIPRRLPRVACDGVRIRQVWTNLLINAAKYHQEGESRWVEMGFHGPGDSFSHPARKRPDEYVFYVRDNGIGIPEQFHESIFEMFRRLHPARAYGGGSGAGLAIARRLTRLHGGELWVESAPGQGSTFFFTLGEKPQG
ncbi:ATP-binding protein [Archangium sp.]|uniref:ATP-binding protein n=1 Tax=Archangium sp. TaxID=1872627 RepID=UPI002D61B228|nr:ATP-binding protein [Archangium sp.]HYO57857.1 ATP-binding protein [Archangium sp.]